MIPHPQHRNQAPVVSAQSSDSSFTASLSSRSPQIQTVQQMSAQTSLLRDKELSSVLQSRRAHRSHDWRATSLSIWTWSRPPTFDRPFDRASAPVSLHLNGDVSLRRSPPLIVTRSTSPITPASPLKRARHTESMSSHSCQACHSRVVQSVSSGQR